MSESDRLIDAFGRLRAALLSNDIQSLKKVMAEDYTGYDPLGNPQDLSMSIEAYRPGGVDLDTYDVEDMEVRIIGKVGIITGKGFIHGTFEGNVFEHTLRFLDIYIARDSGWQLIMSQVTPLVTA